MLCWYMFQPHSGYCMILDAHISKASKLLILYKYNDTYIHIQLTVHVSFCYEIFTDWNVRITLILLVIYQNKHLLDCTNLDLFDYPDSRHHFWEKTCSSVSLTVWSPGFWGTFICSYLNHYWIALRYMFGSSKRSI